ncbi:MAG: anti-sigma factor [Geminicoccaceae bacterium]
MAAEEPLEVQAGEYVLGLLDAQERAAFELRLVRDAELAGLVEEWRAHLLPLDQALAPVVPRVEVWRQISRTLTSRQPRPRRDWWRGAGFWRGWAVAATAATFALLVLLRIAPPTPPQLVAVLNDGTGQPAWIVSAGADPAGILARPLAAVPEPARVPELWLIPQAGGAPISLGTLDRQGNNRRQLAPGLLASGATLAVSLEPPGGSPTGQPTGPVVSSGRLVPQPF